MAQVKPNALPHGIPLVDAVRVWLRVAALSFGGPAGQIAVMHRILVEEKRWIGEKRFLHALNYCMLLPGPEAQQLTIYIGWLLHKTVGGLIAGILFILPGFLSILALSYVYILFGHVEIVEGLFFGLKAAVLAIVFYAVVRLGRRILGNAVLIAMAMAAFVAIFFLNIPFPLIILTAALIGFLSACMGSEAFQVGRNHHDLQGADYADEDSALGTDIPEHARHNTVWALTISVLFLALWLMPVGLLLLTLGADHVFSQIATFFSKMAVVTFGGAYAVLAYVAQEAVQNYGWLAPGEMLDGLGMAETTPGPLIQVVQFVGFMGAYRAAGALDPMLAASLAALLTTWVTFVPCFLWIFLGAPFMEALRHNQALAGAMTAITAAVVGVILNLALWFALHALFGETQSWQGFGLQVERPVWGSLNPAALALTLAAIIALFRFRMNIMLLLAACAGAGMVLFALDGLI